MTLQVPISLDFFQCPPLPPTDIARFIALGEKAAKDLVEFTQLVGGSINWAFYAQDDKVKLFRGRHENVPLFCAHTEIEATLDDIIPNFLTFDTPSVRASAFTFFPDIMDIVRLYNITMPTPRRPHHYLGINWCLLATPLAGIVVKRRDLCYLEYQDNLVVGGKRAWVRALVHVEVPACPDLQLKYGIVRGKMLHSGFIYVECDQPGVLQVFELQHVQPNGSIRGSIGDYLVTKSAVSQCGNLNLLGQKLRAAKLSRLQFLPDHAVVSLSARSSCHVCDKKFGHLRRRHNCRRCGEVVCGRPCSTMWKLMASGIRVHVRLCCPCATLNLPESNDSVETSLSIANSTDDYQESLHHHVPTTMSSHLHLVGPPSSAAFDDSAPFDAHSTMRTEWVTQDDVEWVTYKPSLDLDSISDATSPMSTPHHTNTPSLLAQSSTPLRAKQDMPFGRYAVALGKIGTASLSSSTGANRAYHQTQ
ncbi:hypothetical protein H310_12283 [Aphanomyces invadans]|uniref:FYVE-type domain-containing protein n=1 Tax=Aphanomyces invadans TaxID=157072 RepID=A0A024TIT7_9STRA|nr:hypothetical protein H310_12283 [Aphanomyces invadans]ETV93948.1 hypothetical protein H310_12283 [Aphanomyces invadans]|eukprot:XP_008877508.1 hypothetical protein H310_12283 [Aphanomyces invadans]